MNFKSTHNRPVLTKFSHAFLKLSLEWLNDEEIAMLTNTPHFSREDQTKWYHSIKNKSDYKIWGIEYNSKKIGACGLKNITVDDCEYWAYIGVKDFWSIGIGYYVISTLIEKARDMKLKSIWLRVNPQNIRAMNLYKKMDFNFEDRTGNIIVMKKILK